MNDKGAPRSSPRQRWPHLAIISIAGILFLVASGLALAEMVTASPESLGAQTAASSPGDVATQMPAAGLQAVANPMAADRPDGVQARETKRWGGYQPDFLDAPGNAAQHIDTGEPQASAVWYATAVTYEIFHHGKKVKEGELPLGAGTVSTANSEPIRFFTTTYAFNTQLGMNFSYPLEVRQGVTATFDVEGSTNMSSAFAGDQVNRWCKWQFEVRQDWQYREKYEYCTETSVSWTVKAPTYYRLPFQGLLTWEHKFRAYASLTRSGGFDYANTWIEVKVTYSRCRDPSACVQIRGRVYVPGSTYPLKGVPVTLLRGDNLIRRAVTSDSDGSYVMPNVPITNSARISVTLEHAVDITPTFRIMYGQQAGPLAYVATRPFDITGLDNPLYKDVGFYDQPDIVTDPAIPRERLDDLGMIYYHIHEAWQLVNSVSERLDFQLPVDIVAYSSQNGVFWRGPFTDGSNPGVDPFINIQAANWSSNILDGDRPDNREWHEFGHHVMADTFGNRAPANPGDANHGGSPPPTGYGFANPSTTDSWTEGFAEFFSLMVGRNIAARPQEELGYYRLGGSPVDLESNFRAWSIEELAVAGLLWDLVDPADAEDASIMNGVTYADCVEVSFENFLWDLLRTDWGDAVPRPAASVSANFGYIFDVKMLYDVLKLKGVGSSQSRGREQTDLDELFVAHGFFYDVNDDGFYDSGEEVGRAADPARPTRRNVPTHPGSFISLQARDAQTGAPIDVQNVTVEMRFAPPFERFSYSYDQNLAQTPGKIFFLPPDPQYQVTAYISARGVGSVSTEPLAVTNALYWQEMAKKPTQPFAQHTFQMKPGSRVYLPLVVRAATGSSNQTASTYTPSRVRTQARTPKPCTPEGSTPTPTPTPTATPRPGAPVVQSIVPASAPPGTSAQVTIYGYLFRPGAVPYIGNVALQNVEYLDPEPPPSNRSRIRAILPGGLAPGSYDVVVVNPDGLAGALPKGFTIGGTPTPTATPTRSPTPTSTPTPTPTSTSGLIVSVGRAWTTGDDDKVRMAFVPGEAMKLVLSLTNNRGNTVSVQAEWNVVDERGARVDALSWSGTLNLPPGTSSFSLSRTIPANQPIGPYTLSGRVTFEGRTSTQDAEFYVPAGLHLADDFAVPSSGWPSNDTANYAVGYVNGEYRILVKAADWTVWASNSATRLGDFVLEADARRVSSAYGAYGLLFGLSDDSSSYSALLVDPDGYFLVTRYSSSAGWQDLTDWADSPALNVDQTPNHLMVVRRGSQILVYANGKRLATVSDPQLPPNGRQGLIGLAWEDNVDDRFDSFRLYSPSAGAGPETESGFESPQIDSGAEGTSPAGRRP